MFIEYAIWYDKESMAVKVLNQLLQTDKENMRYLLDLAQMEFLDGRYDESLLILKRAEETGDKSAECKIKFLKAKIAFAKEENTNAQTFYWDAIGAIKDSL